MTAGKQIPAVNRGACGQRQSDLSRVAVEALSPLPRKCRFDSCSLGEVG